MLERNLQIRCAWCGKTNTLGEWNDKTYEKCTSRAMKRAFTSLTQKKAFMKNADTYYLCPDCGKWCKGSQLKIVNTDNKELLKLGGESVFSPVKK